MKCDICDEEFDEQLENCPKCNPQEDEQDKSEELEESEIPEELEESETPEELEEPDKSEELEESKPPEELEEQEKNLSEDNIEQSVSDSKEKKPLTKKRKIIIIGLISILTILTVVAIIFMVTRDKDEDNNNNNRKNNMHSDDFFENQRIMIEYGRNVEEFIADFFSRNQSLPLPENIVEYAEQPRGHNVVCNIIEPYLTLEVYLGACSVNGSAHIFSFGTYVREEDDDEYTLSRNLLGVLGDDNWGWPPARVVRQQSFAMMDLNFDINSNGEVIASLAGRTVTMKGIDGRAKYIISSGHGYHSTIYAISEQGKLYHSTGEVIDLFKDARGNIPYANDDEWMYEIDTRHFGRNELNFNNLSSEHSFERFKTDVERVEGCWASVLLFGITESGEIFQIVRPVRPNGSHSIGKTYEEIFPHPYSMHFCAEFRDELECDFMWVAENRRIFINDIRVPLSIGGREILINNVIVLANYDNAHASIIIVTTDNRIYQVNISVTNRGLNINSATRLNGKTVAGIYRRQSRFDTVIIVEYSDDTRDAFTSANVFDRRLNFLWE